MAANHPDVAATSRPGLTALVVYLRPAPRSYLLQVLADLGIFVVEHQGAESALHTAYATRSDFVIAVGDDDPAHAEVARNLLDALSSVLVAIVAAGASPDRYLAAGAMAVIPEDVTEAEFAALIGPAVRRARWLRSLGEMAAEFIVFRDIRFRTMPPELEREGHAIPLTRVETEVLLELSRSLGKPVRAADLQRRLESLSTRPEVHAGYLKTIVLRIRRKVEELGGNPLMLRSVRGVGYMLTA